MRRQQSAQTVEIESDVYKLTVDLKGVSIVRAELITYPLEKKAGSTECLFYWTINGNDFYHCAIRLVDTSRDKRANP